MLIKTRNLVACQNLITYYSSIPFSRELDTNKHRQTDKGTTNFMLDLTVKRQQLFWYTFPLLWPGKGQEYPMASSPRFVGVPIFWNIGTCLRGP